ncbi:VOC family protein [Cellulomonas sp. NS3]|uniref:VOC family protein n=1 Tax=Cellulomonas sp. NS3 TaxID=2973977 RepID=UPI002162B724|nr:VOC family protein [Cellulomonas sp. NS3]
MVFVNLPVRDLARSTAFFTALGLDFDPQYTDERAACLVLGSESFVMLLVDPFFATFTTKPVADATTATEVIVAFSVGSRSRVDEVVEAALAAGGSTSTPGIEEDGMYSRSFQDPDGHVWEAMFMEPAGAGG